MIKTFFVENKTTGVLLGIYEVHSGGPISDELFAYRLMLEDCKDSIYTRDEIPTNISVTEYTAVEFCQVRDRHIMVYCDDSEEWFWADDESDESTDADWEVYAKTSDTENI